MSKTLKIILGILAAFVVLIIIAVIFVPTEEDEIIPGVDGMTPDLKPKTQTPPKSATWNKVVEFSGKSIKNTETFRITSFEWRIDWVTKPGEYGDMNFQIYVHKSSGELYEVAANVIGEDRDSSIMRGAGDYYLQINTAQPYAIIVYEKN